MALSKIGTFFDAIFYSEEYKDTGSTGERFTYRMLKESFLASAILRNVYIEKDNDKSTEIDMLAVGNKGIYVIESKNYSGTIYGSIQNQNWTQYLNPKEKHQFYNPIKQNESHIGALKSYLSDYPDIAYFNIVVFSERCKLKIDEHDLTNTYIVKRDLLTKTISQIANSHMESISPKQKKEILSLLSSNSRPDATIQEKHVQQVKENLSKCPFCNIELVERKNKKTGDSFWGCANYPKCKFTRKSLQ